MRSLRNWSPAGCKELQIMAECSTRKSDVISSLYALIFKSNKKQHPIPSRLSTYIKTFSTPLLSNGIKPSRQ